MGTYPTSDYKKEKKNETEMKKIKKLIEIGFIWDAQEYQWNQKYNELKQYISTHGDCRVPLDLGELGNLVDTQRTMYKKIVKSKKDLEHIEKLTRAGFVWKEQKGPRRCNLK